MFTILRVFTVPRRGMSVELIDAGLIADIKREKMRGTETQIASIKKHKPKGKQGNVSNLWREMQ